MTNVHCAVRESGKHHAQGKEPDTPAECCMTLFLQRNIRSRLFLPWRQRADLVARSWGREQWGGAAEGCGVSFGGEDNLLEFDASEGCTAFGIR